MPKPPELRIPDSQAPATSKSLHIIDNADNVQKIPVSQVPVPVNTQQNIIDLPENPILSDAAHISISQPIISSPAKVAVRPILTKKRKRSIFSK